MAVSVEEVKSIAALSNLSLDRLESLSRVMIRHTYAPGELIFLEGDPARGIWFILKGRVRIVKQSMQGRVQALCVASAGRCFGGCPLFDGDVNPANAQAIDEVVLVVLNDEDKQQLSERDPELLWALLQVFSQRLAHLSRLSEGLGAWDVATRINDCLLTHINTKEPPSVDFTHEKLAQLVGTVREVVTRHLACLEDEGIVRLEAGRIVLVDIDRLRCSCITSQI